MKYIDSEKLIAEIKRRIEEYNIQSLRGAELADICSFITSLQQEQPEVGLDVSRFCQPISKNIVDCIAEHYWEMLGEEEKEDTKAIEASSQQKQPEVDLEKEISDTCRGYRIRGDFDGTELNKHDIENIARHFYELGLNAKNKV